MEKKFILVTAHGELSLAEVSSYLETEKINYCVMDVSKQAIILDAPNLKILDLMHRLGGIYKIGSAASVIERSDMWDILRMKEKLDSADFYSSVDEKVRWGISIYQEEVKVNPKLSNFLQDYFHDRLKKNGANRAKYIRPKRAGEVSLEIISNDLVKKRIVSEGLEIIVISTPERFYVGRTLEVVRNQEFINRDFGRPFQNPKLSVSPKMARILVNLTGLCPDETLLDPFCGIGTILQEAALLGIKIIGADIDGQRVTDTIENLKWLNETYHLKIKNIRSRVFTVDARHISRRLPIKVDGIATEPILLPPLKKFPSEKEAKEMLKKAFEVYKSSLPEMTKVLKKKGRLVIVFPHLRTTDHKEMSFNIKEVFNDVGLSLYSPSKVIKFNYPLMASSNRSQKVLRGIYILEKR